MLSSLYPKDFLWGVAMASYQVEGYLNGPEYPSNNWHQWENRKNFQPSGKACDFWNRYEEDIERAASLGINAFRLSIEWARLQKGWGCPIEEKALHRYVDILGTLFQKKILPVLTLQHFTHPSWLGLHPWLSEKGALAFEDFLEKCIPLLNEKLQAKYGSPPLPFYVTVNEPNVLGLSTHLLGVFPHQARKKGFSSYHRHMIGILKGHLLAYRKIHEIYAKKGWLSPTVTFNNWGCGTYMLDKFFMDLMGLEGEEKTLLQQKIPSLYASWRGKIENLLQETKFSRWRIWLERTIDKKIHHSFPQNLYQELLRFRGRSKHIDAISFDYYDPFLTKYLLAPGALFRKYPWQWDTAPEQLEGFTENYLEGHEQPILYILENGMCYRKSHSSRAFRGDGKKRGEEMKKHISALDRLISRKVPVKGYFYWSLTDNYEWGSFLPRFGLFGIDYASGKRMDSDVSGEEAGKLYRSLLEERRK